MFRVAEIASPGLIGQIFGKDGGLMLWTCDCGERGAARDFTIDGNLLRASVNRG